MGKFIDLTGQRFGSWTVLRLSQRIDNRSRCWLCRCDCGTERDVRTFSLRNGQSTSCGECDRIEIQFGKRFGAWTVLRPRSDSTPTAAAAGYAAVTAAPNARCKVAALRGARSTSCGQCNKLGELYLGPGYGSWKQMKNRCDNPNAVYYANYGGRGITYD